MKNENRVSNGGSCIMQLDKILDAIISKEVYKEVKVECSGRNIKRN
jgi:hypothetical protein